MSPADAGEVVNERAWQILREHVEAASIGDRAAFVFAGERASQNALRLQRLAGLYVIHLLKYRLFEVNGRRVPTIGDLRLVAESLTPRYAALLPNTDRALLEETLRTSFKLSEPNVEVRGATFTLSALATLGLILDDSSQIEDLRPYLADWCARNHSSIDEVAGR